jgi:hypothetical protein
LSDETRSSCTGSSCANPHEIDHDHEEIELDSLEDLAKVIDNEIVQQKHDHVHVNKDKPHHEYESFIKDDESEASIPSSVDVASVSAPTYEDVHPEVPAEPYVPPKREKAVYEAIALPTFSYKPAAKAKPEPKPVKEAPKPQESHTLKGTDDDIWGSYLAKYNKPAGGYKAPAAPAKPVEPWKPRPYQAFDFGKYALKAREDRYQVDDGYGGDAPWWEKKGKDRKGPRKNVPWWEELTYDMPEDDDYEKPSKGRGGYKPAYKPYVPRSTYQPKPYTPRVKYEARPLQKYWWQK